MIFRFPRYMYLEFHKMRNFSLIYLMHSSIFVLYDFELEEIVSQLFICVQYTVQAIYSNRLLSQASQTGSFGHLFCRAPYKKKIKIPHWFVPFINFCHPLQL
jgi:hypothetical protein